MYWWASPPTAQPPNRLKINNLKKITNKLFAGAFIKKGLDCS